VRIAWVGGLDRNEAALSRMAIRAGHRLDFHTGSVGGRGAGELKAAIEGAVLLAKKIAQKLARPTLVLRRCGPTRFQQLLDAIAARDERLRVAS